MTQQNSAEFVALIPAGGSGSRLGAAQAKQYLPFGATTMIAHTLQALLAMPWINHVYIVVSAGDHAQGLCAGLDTARSTCLPVGGASRRDSVLAGLHQIKHRYRREAEPWVMVHDAARPGVSPAILTALRGAIDRQLADQCQGSPDGAIVALPVADTVKRALPKKGAVSRIAATVDRDGLWLAQTPQVFPLAALTAALEAYAQATDEASAMEKSGAQPELVPGHWHNMKITVAQDLELMKLVLATPATTAIKSSDTTSGNH